MRLLFAKQVGVLYTEKASSHYPHTRFIAIALPWKVEFLLNISSSPECRNGLGLVRFWLYAYKTLI